MKKMCPTHNNQNSSGNPLKEGGSSVKITSPGQVQETECLNDFPGCLSVRVTIRSVLIVRTVYKAVQAQKSSGATSTRPLHLCTLRTAVELQFHLTTPPEDMAVAINH